ncbi:MAG TPA: pentapeptide repeat-containing protein [Methylocella sp.]|nr:pentapeptide repeat-containing protein [Methylocella sp.]
MTREPEPPQSTPQITGKARTADQELVALLRLGAVEWNRSFETLNRKAIDLSGANLGEANLFGAGLRGANLFGADLSGVDLYQANFSGARLNGAFLDFANFTRANLSKANLHEAQLFETVFADVDLSAVTGLETCRHMGPRRCKGPAVCLWRFCVAWVFLIRSLTICHPC